MASLVKYGANNGVPAQDEEYFGRHFVKPQG